ncbi:MAG: rhomboid family intramembrane serine protease [Bacteroidetes bacterium]|nr:MAG: rhomboid family intramembrane serine protease [Bacteroidota bacterium]
MTATATLIILILTIGISILCFQNYDAKYRLIFSPTIIEERKEWYRFFTSGLIHADWIHLGVNMYVLWSFGQVVETYFKMYFEFPMIKYMMMYFMTVVLANVKTFYKERYNDAYFSLGASGGVSGVVFSSIMFDPFANVYLYAALPIPGWLMGIGYLVLSQYMAKRGRDNINHDAHFWGAVVGAVYTLVLKPDLILRLFDRL